MHKNNITNEEIMKKINVQEYEIINAIKYYENKKEKEEKEENINKKINRELNNEENKKEINEMKNRINELEKQVFILQNIIKDKNIIELS